MSLNHIRNESEEQIACARDMFETIFRDYPQEKDVHISGLLVDLMKQTGGLCGAGGSDPVDPARSGFLLGADAAGLDPSDARSEDRCRLGRPSFRRFADGSLHRNDPRIPGFASDAKKRLFLSVVRVIGAALVAGLVVLLF